MQYTPTTPTPPWSSTRKAAGQRRPKPAVGGDRAKAWLGRFIPLMLIAWVLAAPAGAAVFTVGSDSACNFETLQEALQATLDNDAPMPTDDTIRVARNQTHVGIFEIYDQVVTIRGGYDSCADVTPSGHTKLIRQPGVRHFTIFSDAVSYTRVTLSGLELIYDHPVPSDVDVGGSIYQRGQTHLTIYNSFVGDGAAEIGGGIFVDGQDGAYLRLDELSVVWNSQARFGGGVACLGEGDVHMSKSAVVLDNKADSAGGGVFLDGCTLYQELQMPLAGVIRNTAEEGGGIFATGGARADLFGNVLANYGRDGGGILVEGEGSLVVVQGLVADNAATGDGAGIYARSQSNVSVFYNHEQCDDLSQCAAIVGNRAIGIGGGLYAGSGAYMHVNRALLADNGSDIGAVAVVDGETSGLHLENSVIVGNAGDVLIQVANGANMRAYHLTVADNHRLNTRTGEIWYLVNMPSDTEIWNTIFWDDDGLFHDAGGAPAGAFNCLLIPDIFVDPGTSSATVGVPDFADEAARDFRLGLGSDAVDLCRPGLFPTPDRDRQPRVVNDLADAGAFERQL